MNNDHIKGIYFVPNSCIDLISGFPIHPECKVTNELALINFLNNSENSYQIQYFYSKRKNNIPPFPFRSSAEFSKPQYYDCEDLAVGEIALRKGQEFLLYPGNVSISFSYITNTDKVDFKNNEPYFSMGYPAFWHYDLNDFSTHPQYELIQKYGPSPPLVLSKTCQKFCEEISIPCYENDEIRHGIPTAQGMSGGPLVRIGNNWLEVFGIINGRKKKD